VLWVTLLAVFVGFPLCSTEESGNTTKKAKKVTLQIPAKEDEDGNTK